MKLTTLALTMSYCPKPDLKVTKVPYNSYVSKWQLETGTRQDTRTEVGMDNTISLCPHVFHHANNGEASHWYTEHKDSVQYSQEPAIGPYPKPDESSPYPPILPLYNPF
jgi:hypothetical protein